MAACQAPIKSDHSFDRSAPFGMYASYAWVTSEPMIPAQASVTQNPMLGPILEQIIRRAIERELESKGYTQARTMRNADLILSFSLGTRDKIQVDSYPATMGYGYGRGAWYSTVDVHTYTEGILAIDFFDGETRQAVWHGWASKRISSRASAEEREANVKRATAAILADFPIRNIGP